MTIREFKELYDSACMGLDFTNQLYFKREEMIELLPQSKDFALVYGKIESIRCMLIKIVKCLDSFKDGNNLDLDIETIDKSEFDKLIEASTSTFLLLGSLYMDKAEKPFDNVEPKTNTILSNTVNTIRTLDKLAIKNHWVSDDAIMRETGNYPYWDNKEIMRIAHGEHNNR